MAGTGKPDVPFPRSCAARSAPCDAPRGRGGGWARTSSTLCTGGDVFCCARAPKHAQKGMAPQSNWGIWRQFCFWTKMRKEIEGYPIGSGKRSETHTRLAWTPAGDSTSPAARGASTPSAIQACRNPWSSTAHGGQSPDAGVRTWVGDGAREHEARRRRVRLCPCLC